MKAKAEALGISHERPNTAEPGSRPAMQSWRTRTAEMPRIEATAAGVIGSIRIMVSLVRANNGNSKSKRNGKKKRTVGKGRTNRASMKD